MTQRVTVEIQGLEHLSAEAQAKMAEVISRIIKEERDEPPEVAEEEDETLSMSAEELWETKKRVMVDFNEIIRKIDKLISHVDENDPAVVWYHSARDLATHSRKMVLSGLDVAYDV